MQKRNFPWVIIAIEAVSYAAWGVTGLILASLGLGIVYLISLRTHPRVRHTGFRSCSGTGEVRSALFPWTFHRCANCNGGRLVRWGAGRWGAPHARSEHAKTKLARKTAKGNRAWR